MQKYTDIVLGQNGQTVLPITGALVTVFAYPSNTLATIYSDNGVTATSNPVTTDTNGRFSFYAANGRYSLSVAFSGVSYTLQDVPLEDDPAQAQPVVTTTLQVTDTTQSTSTTTGALTVAGGVGIAKDVFCGGTFHGSIITSAGTIDNIPVGSTTPNTGAFTTLSASSTVSGVGFSTYLASPPAIGGTVANAGSFTNLSSSGTVSGVGFSNYLASPPSIGSTAPGAASFTSLSASGNFTPSQTNGIIGTTTNNNANAGSWGEYVSATASGVSLSTGTAANITSISLTAGDWDVTATVSLVGSVTNMTNSIGGTNTTSATVGGVGTYYQFSGPTTQSITDVAPVVRYQLAGPSTIFAVGLASFASGTVTAAALIRARRVR